MAVDLRGLFERDHLFAELREHARAALRGQGRVVLLVGEPGVGKTSLLRALLEEVRKESVVVSSVRAHPLESSFPFGVVRRLVEVPGGAPAQSWHPLNDGVDLQAPLERLSQMMARLAARGPIVLAVDDVHEADAETLRFLHYASDRLLFLPVLVIGTTRPPGASPRAALVQALLKRADTIELGPLTEEGVRALLEEATVSTVDAGFAAAAHRAAGGNPFFTRELARAVVQAKLPPVENFVDELDRLVPHGVASAFRSRIEDLDAETLGVVRALAVLGRPADLGTLAALTDLDRDAVARHVDVLVDAYVFTPATPVDFAHPLLRRAAYQATPPDMRDGGHRRAAALLRQQAVPSLDALAGHLMATDPVGDRETAATLVEAARAAVRRGAYDSGVLAFRRALAEPVADSDLDGVLTDLARAELALGNAGEAVLLLEAALARTQDILARAAVAELLGDALSADDRPGEAARLLVGVLAALPDDAVELGYRLEAKLGWLDDLTLDTGVRTLSRGSRFAGPTPARPVTHGERLQLAYSADREMNVGRAADAVRLARAALDEGGLLAEEGLSFGFYATSMILYYCGDLAGAQQSLQAGVERARQLGTEPGALIAEGFLAGPRIRRGELAAGGAAAEVALGLLPAGAVPGVYLTAFLLESLRERGRLARAAEVLARAGYAERVPSSSSTLLLLSERSRLRLALGDPAGALEDARELRARMTALGMTSTVPRSPAIEEALALQALGRVDAAAERVTAAVEESQAFGSPLCVGVALAAAGRVTGRKALLSRALEPLSDIGATVELARARLWLGDRRAQDGDIDGATSALVAVLRAARTTGATPLEAAAAAGLRRLGRDPREVARPGAAALTQTERRVAEKAAGGLSNRDIAAALQMGQRTVETHLARVYRKLAIRSRRALAGALNGVDGDPMAGAPE